MADKSQILEQLIQSVSNTGQSEATLLKEHLEGFREDPDLNILDASLCEVIIHAKALRNQLANHH